MQYLSLANYCPDSEVRLLCGKLRSELRNQRDSSKSMILVPLLNPKFAIELAAIGVCELRVRGTSLGLYR